MTTNKQDDANSQAGEVRSSEQLGLVERLRQQYPETPYHRDALHREAADEIDRLKAWIELAFVVHPNLDLDVEHAEAMLLDTGDDQCEVLDGRLQRCAACGEVFDIDDHAEEDDDE